MLRFIQCVSLILKKYHVFEKKQIKIRILTCFFEKKDYV